MSNKLYSFFAFAILMIAMSFPALADQWKVVRVNQPAEISGNGTDWEPLKPGMIIVSKAWIKTGIRGRAMLRRDKETILYRANTQARLVQSNRSGRKTELLQTAGRLLVDVETRKYKHTKVTTPYLAVVVKGTRFEVFVGSGRSTVKVQRGLVEVTDPRRGERVNVARGQNVTLNRRNNSQMQLRGRGKKAPIVNARSGKPVATTSKSNRGGNSANSNGKAIGKTSNNGNGAANGNNGNGNSGNNGNGNGNSGNNGNGNGNSGNNGNGNGNSGNNGNGNGNSGNNGNGNGNNGNGNGNS